MSRVRTGTVDEAARPGPSGAKRRRATAPAADAAGAVPDIAPRAEHHAWAFKARFRRHAFGWRSPPAIARLRQAVGEIKKVAKRDPRLAAEGAVAFFERVSPALERVDSSSGAIGTAVGHAIAELVPLVTRAPADAKTRDAWLERLFEAHAADEVPYIEQLADHWGELCASPAVASAWADRLLDLTRRALDPGEGPRAHFHGTTACVSALYHAERFDELVELLNVRTLWPYKQWAARALAAQGKVDEALRYAEACRSPWATDHEVSAVCEAILLAAGRVDEAYARYGVRACQGGTYLSTFRAIAKTYPHKSASDLLADLVKTTPGDEGKWFAAAKEAGLYDEALALASRTPCDPKTLARAARDYAGKQPAFALGAGLLALAWLVRGYGYEVTGADVWDAYRATLASAERLGNAAGVKERVRALVASENAGDRFVVLPHREMVPEGQAQQAAFRVGSLGSRTPTCRLAAAHRAWQGLEPRRGLPKAPWTRPSTARHCLPRSPAFARRLPFGRRLEPSAQGSTAVGSRGTAPTSSRLASSKRRASVARQACPRRGSVRNGPSGNVPGCSCGRRASSSFAVPSGLASSQARTVGHTSSNASWCVRPWRGGRAGRRWVGRTSPCCHAVARRVTKVSRSPPGGSGATASPDASLASRCCSARIASSNGMGSSAAASARRRAATSSLTAPVASHRL
jgi:hypothetical protein